MRRLGVIILSAISFTFIMFWLTNLYPKLELLAKTQGKFRMSDEAVLSYLGNRGYLQALPVKNEQWLGLVSGYVIEGSDGEVRAKCERNSVPTVETPDFCGIIQGKWGF